MQKDGKDIGGDVFYIVSELCHNGEMFDYIQLAEGLPDKIAKSIFG
jgi:hypothetical protein